MEAVLRDEEVSGARRLGKRGSPSRHVELVLANAQQVRNLPGRKSDMNDATWLAELMAHGLVRGSFVPPEPIRELRDQTRTRAQLVGEVRRHLQRIQKVLLDANIQVAGRITNLLGRTGRAMLDALVAGQTDPERLADLASASRRRAPSWWKRSVVTSRRTTAR